MVSAHGLCAYCHGHKDEAHQEHPMDADCPYLTCDCLICYTMDEIQSL